MDEYIKYYNTESYINTSERIILRPQGGGGFIVLPPPVLYHLRFSISLSLKTRTYDK